jgi:hypothetical protein
MIDGTTAIERRERMCGSGMSPVAVEPGAQVTHFVRFATLGNVIRRT